MRQPKSMQWALILLVFCIMIISAVVGISALYILQRVRIVDQFRDVPMVFLIIGLITAIILGTLLMVPFSKAFLKPIDNIIQATKEVGSGNFDVQLPKIEQSPLKPVEIVELTNNFNTMIKELSSIELMKKDFINNFSHEFKTPISSIVGFTKELQREDISDEERKLYLSIMENELQRLSQLSSTILTITKLENQNIITNKTIYNLDEQLRECIVLLQKNLELVLELDPVTFCGNKDLMSQVWINVLGNAIKFSNEKEEIKISLHQHNDWATIQIIDHGIGISKADLVRVYDKFYQADTAHSTMGNGLGLALVKKIIDLSHGQINIESELNKGTIVTIDLPIEKNKKDRIFETLSFFAENYLENSDFKDSFKILMKLS